MLGRVRVSWVWTPGGVFHIGAERSAVDLTIVALMNDDAAILYMVQLVSVAEGRPAQVSATIESAGLAGLVQAMPDGFIVLDRAGVILEANPSFLQTGRHRPTKSEVVPAIGWTAGWVGGKTISTPCCRACDAVAPCAGFSTTLRCDKGGARVEVETRPPGGDAEEDPAYVGVVVRELARRIPAVGRGNRRRRYRRWMMAKHRSRRLSRLPLRWSSGTTSKRRCALRMATGRLPPSGLASVAKALYAKL